MENFIEVFDNFLPEKLVDDIENNCIHNQKIDFLYFNNITSTDPNKIFPGLTHSFDRGEEGVGKTNSYFNQILYHFCVKRNIIVSKIENGRVFLTFPNLSKNPCHIHTDRNTPHWVCLYYINEADGDTVFYNNNQEEIKRVSPKKGRIIFFDGSIIHSGTFPSQFPRFIVNFNFLGKFI
jgi:hypothetical protein